jgi:tRNA threonylcarbamoyladenosine biosynthesis protein TsaE
MRWFQLLNGLCHHDELSIYDMNASSITIITRSPEETRRLGVEFGKHLTPGMILALTGDLGSGKTVFVQGLAAGFDVPEAYPVTSPTYTLVNEYPGRLPLFHIDLYRLEYETDLEDIGLYDILWDKAAAAIEWADRLHEGFLTEYVAVRFKAEGETLRNIRISSYGLAAENLIHEVEKKF